MRAKLFQQRGLALITVMLIVAVVASVAAYMGLGQQVWLRQAQNIVERAQAESVRQGAVNYVQLSLERDASNNQTDDLQELWATQLPPFPVEDGAVLITIEDAQGRFNLNNLINNDDASSKDAGVFRRLLTSLELNPELVEPLVDWMDSNDTIRGGGAEDADYLANKTPYRAANQLLEDVGELRLVKGFTPKAAEKLRPWVTVLPARTAINVNTAPATVLAALFTDMSSVAAEKLADDIRKNPLKNTSDLEKLTSGKKPQVDYDIKTSYFLVNIEPRFGRYSQRSQTLVYRPGAGKTASTVWRNREPVVVAQSESNQ